MTGTLTITVLFYDEEFVLELRSEVISNCEVAAGGRVMLSDNFKKGKLIIAVLEGNVKILN